MCGMTNTIKTFRNIHNLSDQPRVKMWTANHVLNNSAFMLNNGLREEHGEKQVMVTKEKGDEQLGGAGKNFPASENSLHFARQLIVHAKVVDVDCRDGGRMLTAVLTRI